MNPEDMKQRTRNFALSVIKVVNSLPKGQASDVIGRQLLKSGTSVGANYRSACRAKSTADFINKMCIVEEEADESGYWMILFIESGLVSKKLLEGLEREAHELLAITVASIATAKKRMKKQKSGPGLISQSEIRNPQ